MRPACRQTPPVVLHAHLHCAQGPRCSLATRILFQCAHARGDEDALMVQHSALSDSLEDQLSLAALHFNRGHFQVCVWACVRQQ
jgi:intraflagellar transport protein 56